MPSPLGLNQLHERDAAEAKVPDTNLGPYLNRVIWTLAALSGLFLGLRLYYKIFRRRQLWWDDYVLVASWVSLTVSISLQTAATNHGLGRNYAYLDEQQITDVAIFSISAGFCTILATCWSKTSFAISLLRISTGWVRTCVWVIIISVNLVLAANGTIQWVQCWPVRKLWYWEMEGSCLPPMVVQNFNVFVAAFSGFMDIVLALLPWKIIWTVAINKREKLGALIAMSAGVISGVMAFLKIMTLYVIGNPNSTTVDLMIFGTAEPATIIMAASMPILRTLISRKPTEPKPVQFIDLDRRTTRSTASKRNLATGSPAPDPLVVSKTQVHEHYYERSSGEHGHEGKYGLEVGG